MKVSEEDKGKKLVIVLHNISLKTLTKVPIKTPLKKLNISTKVIKLFCI